MLRTDRGGEFNSNELGEYFSDLGVQRQLMAVYSPQQNGVVERRNQTVVGMARCLLKTRNVPARFWGEAVTTAVYLLNRGTTKSVAGKTPFEAWHGRRPSVQHLRVFGCVAHVKVTRPNLKKLVDRSIPMVLLGYEPGSAAYRVYDPAARKVHVSRDVVFDEDAAWNWASAEKQQGDAADTFTVEHLVIPISGADGSWNTTRSGRAPDMPSENGTRTERAHDVDDHATAGTGNAPSPAPPATPATPPSRMVEFASPPSNASQPSPGEEAPRRYRLLEELYDVDTSPTYP
jgi:hypothetical protein